MKKEFETLWRASSKQQDLRGDKGHAETVVAFAEQLSKALSADEKIVIPAAILHDIGYYGMKPTLLEKLMRKELSEKEEREIKATHMIQGAKAAKNLLSAAGYDDERIRAIVSIVARHDKNDASQSVEERIVRDADRLWRYSRKGFWLDVHRRSCSPEQWHEKLLKNLNREDYFQTEEAKQIARQELALREQDALRTD